MTTAPAPAPAIEAAKTRSSSSILTMHDLNEDVVTEVLLRLPSSASVARCRAVCRAWRAITSSPGFVAAYGQRRPLELIVQRHPGDKSVVDAIPFDDVARRRCLHPGPGYPSGVEDYWLMGSCDGLLLFERFHDPRPDHLIYWVCDPVTRQWAAVPLPHRSWLTRQCGFYLHTPTGEHRILFLSNDTVHDGLPASHYVHSLETAETRRLGPALEGLHIFAQTMPYYLDYHGKLHWIKHPEVQHTNDILVFDTVSEVFRRMSRPPPTRNGGDDLSHWPLLLEMDGMLAAMTTVILNRRITHMELWVLEDYTNDKSWTCRHRIHPPPQLFRACWAINYSSTSVIILGDDLTRSSIGLYDLTQNTENGVVKQIQLNRIHPAAFVFKDSLQRHAFLFDRQK